MLSNSVKDFGFKRRRTLCPTMHIQSNRCKVFKILRFVNRVSAEFQLVASIKIFFLFDSVSYCQDVWHCSLRHFHRY